MLLGRKEHLDLDILQSKRAYFDFDDNKSSEETKTHFPCLDFNAQDVSSKPVDNTFSNNTLETAYTKTELISIGNLSGRRNISWA